MDQIILAQEEPRGPSQLVEVQINSTGQKFPLPDVPQLRSQEGQIIVIKAIRLISAKTLTHSMILEGTNAPLTELQKMALVLYSEGWQKGQLIPVLTLNDQYDSDSNPGTTIPFRTKTTRFDNWIKVDWQQSFIQFANGTSADGNAIPYVVIFEVEYVKLDGNGQPITTG